MVTGGTAVNQEPDNTCCQVGETRVRGFSNPQPIRCTYTRSRMTVKLM
jgi:hypothetical protein